MSTTKLSGADYFFLVIAHHIKKQGITSLDCRYIMKLDQPLKSEVLQQAIANSPYFQLLKNVKIRFRTSGIPKWVQDTEGEDTLLEVHQADCNAIPEKVISSEIPLSGGHLFRFDLVQHPTYSTIVFSWHHILLDAFGASQVLASLNQPDMADVSSFFGKDVRESKRKQWADLVIAKDFLRDTTKDPLLNIKARYTSKKLAYRERRFSHEETAAIKQQTNKYSRGGIETPYLLGNIAIAYQQILAARGETKKDIWVPIPMEQRKAGATGPIVGNWHSLLFFRIKADLLNDKKALIKDLNSQFFNQVRLGIPQKYSNMLKLLRHLPVSFYYKLIKRPNGESLSGMLYSQSPSHESLSQFLGCQVKDITALPPNTVPPGISFQITTFDQRLKLVIQYSESFFNEAEIEDVFTAVEKELIGENA